jgi:hypothetical protein
VIVDTFVDIEDICLGVAKNNIDLYKRASETGNFWGWMCTSDRKFESSSCGNHLSKFGEMCKHGDKVGILLEFNNGIGTLSFYKNKVRIRLVNCLYRFLSALRSTISHLVRIIQQHACTMQRYR